MFLSPIFVTLLAVPLLGERVGTRRIVGVLIGFEYKKFKPRTTTKPLHKNDLQARYFTTDAAAKYLPTYCLTHRP